MERRGRLRAIAIVVGFLILAVACSEEGEPASQPGAEDTGGPTSESTSAAPADEATSSETAADDATSSETAAADDTAGDVLTTGGHGDEWLVWDAEQGMYVAAEEHPDEWEPVLRSPEEPIDVGHGQLDASTAFGIAIADGVTSVSEEIGNINLTTVNNEWPDTQKPIDNAESLAARGLDLMIEYNGLQAIYPRIVEIFEAESIPLVTVTFKQPNIPVFGANNYDAGLAAATYLSALASEREWPQEEIFVVGCDDIRVGALIRARIDGLNAGINGDLPGVPPANFSTIQCEDTEQTRTTMADWLTAHPQANYILASCISDSRCLGMVNALQAAGRDENAAVVGQGADPSALEVIRAEGSGSFVASVAYFPEDYGEFLFALGLDILEGKPVPHETFVPLEVIDSTNIDEFYPES